MRARHIWMQSCIRSAIADGTTQVVLLRPSYGDVRAYTWPDGEAAQRPQFFEVDESEVLRRKKSLMEVACGPQSRTGMRWPRFVMVSWSNLKMFIPALTAEGFNPRQKSVFILQGLLSHLHQVCLPPLSDSLSSHLRCFFPWHIVHPSIHALFHKHFPLLPFAEGCGQSVLRPLRLVCSWQQGVY
jgi:hypothetical protein